MALLFRNESSPGILMQLVGSNVQLIKLLLFLVLISCSLSVSAEEVTPLDKNKAIYEKSLQKIENNYRTNFKPLNKTYYKRLITLRDKSQDLPRQ